MLRREHGQMRLILILGVVGATLILEVTILPILEGDIIIMQMVRPVQHPTVKVSSIILVDEEGGTGLTVVLDMIKV